MNIGQLFKGGLRTRLMLIIGIFILTAVAQVAVNIKLFSDMQGAATSAQLFGKGRYLGARLLYQVKELANSEDSERQGYEHALRDTVGQMEERFSELRFGKPERDMRATTDPRLLAELNITEGLWRNEAKPLIDALLLGASALPVEASVNALLPVVERIIEEVDKTVAIYEQISQQQQRQAVRIQWLFLGLYGVIFAGVIYVLRGVFANLNDTASNLTRFASQLLSGVSQQVSASQEQAAAVTQTNSTAEELDQTAAQTVEQSRNVMEISKQVADVGEKGAQRVEEAIQAMAHVQEQSERIANNILALAEKTRSVGKIIGVVTDIAEQTNILAINAGIEASRNQVAGSGFTAVAREIKDLAGQSRAATAEVRQILGEVQQSTSSAVMLMEEGSKRIEQGIATINKSRDVIDSLQQAVRESARSATRISASTNQQAIGTSQIRQAMGDISEATNQTVAAVKQVEATASQLNNLSARLRVMLNG